MVSKRKSVTFHENVSMVTPKIFDGFTSPAPIIAVPTSVPQSLELDPMYLTWLRSATKAQYPFIVNGTFAKHIYRQNFDLHLNNKHSGNVQVAQERGAAVTVLAETYGSLGWGSLYKEVTEEAWVKNYRVGNPSCVLGWTSLLKMILSRRSIDLMAQMRSYWRRWPRPTMKCVVRNRRYGL